MKLIKSEKELKNKKQEKYCLACGEVAKYEKYCFTWCEKHKFYLNKDPEELEEIVIKRLESLGL